MVMVTLAAIMTMAEVGFRGGCNDGSFGNRVTLAFVVEEVVVGIK